MYNSYMAVYSSLLEDISIIGQVVRKERYLTDEEYNDAEDFDRY